VTEDWIRVATATPAASSDAALIRKPDDKRSIASFTLMEFANELFDASN
jgi:hypothetical protein